MTHLEECGKAEVEDRVRKSKSKGKLKVAAATIPSTQNDEFTMQLKKQHHQFDTLMGKMKTLVTTLQTQTAQASKLFRQGSHSFGMKGRGNNTYTDRRGDPGGRGLSPQPRLRGQPLPQRPLSQSGLNHPQQGQGTAKTYTDNTVLAVWGSGTPGKELSHVKRQEAVSRGNA